jgi:hypothetical protein
MGARTMIAASGAGNESPAGGERIGIGGPVCASDQVTTPSVATANNNVTAALMTTSYRC